MERESRTIALMISFYCKKQHKNGSLCTECQQLLDYAQERLRKCPFQNNKTTCAKCPVHCYKADMRAKVRAVMRYSGPRMIYRHPILAIEHLIDGLRKQPR
jgi:predicted amidophosphoribosyltransferase